MFRRSSITDLHTKVQAVGNTVKQAVAWVITTIGLFMMYFLGIGVTAIIGKVLQKTFLPKKGEWQTAMYSHSDSNRPY